MGISGKLCNCLPCHKCHRIHLTSPMVLRIIQLIRLILRQTKRNWRKRRWMRNAYYLMTLNCCHYFFYLIFFEIVACLQLQNNKFVFNKPYSNGNFSGVITADFIRFVTFMGRKTSMEGFSSRSNQVKFSPSDFFHCYCI